MLAMEEYPVRPQPEIVEAELGVREYWYNTFYRVVVIPLSNGCYLLSMDVYVENPDIEGEEDSSLQIPNTPARLVYYRLEPDKALASLALPGQARIEEALELVVLEHDEGRELISARLRLCGLTGYPDYNLVKKIYDVVSSMLGFKRVEPTIRPLSSQG